MKKTDLAYILSAAIDRYRRWPYSKVLEIAGETIVEESTGKNPGDVGYWQIEVSIVQKWEEHGCHIIQVLAIITNETHRLGSIIDFDSNGNASVGDYIVELIDGVPKPFSFSQNNPDET